MTVIGTDKTGTLTEGTMVVRRLWTPQGEAEITGTGYAPEGQVGRGGRPLEAATAPDVAGLLAAAVLCNDAALRRHVPGWFVFGHPPEPRVPRRPASGR